MNASLILPSNAKINAGLKIVDQRSDGYHNLFTVFQEISLSDTIHITPQDSGWSLSSDQDWVPTGDSNLCIQAFLKLKELYPGIAGVSIHLEKVIPAGAGLGGGSSNAATVLKGLNKLYQLSIPDAELETIGASIGADVAFFIKGGTQIGEGIGDRLTKMSESVSGIYLIVVPPIHINTKWAYGEVKKHLDNRPDRSNFALSLGHRNISLPFFENDFERIVIPAYPEIGEMKDRLIESGASIASLSGSGSAVFGIFDEEAVAKHAESSFPSHRTFITHPVHLKAC